MQNTYSNFYRQFYMRTGGYIPTWPLNQNVYPGDFFQVSNGEMLLLGNIFRNGIVDPADCPLEYGIKLNPAGWNFYDGVTKPFSGRGTGKSPIEGHFEFSRQMLAFARAGSFLFKAHAPELVRFKNWSELLQQQLIIKLTQTYYSFRQLYLVTETVVNDDWTLAIAGAENAELEIATEEENFGLVDLFGHASAKTILSRNLEYYHRENKRKPGFFSAKKLVVRDDKQQVFMSDLITQRESIYSWANDFFETGFYNERSFNVPSYSTAQASVLDMLSVNELNPNTALHYFQWADTSLNDVEKFFITYGS